MRRARGTFYARRRGLSPITIIFVYIFALLLVVWHQSNRLAAWLDDFAINREGLVSELAFTASSFISQEIWPHGPLQLNTFEDRFLAFFGAQTKFGAPNPTTELASEQTKEERSPFSELSPKPSADNLLTSAEASSANPSSSVPSSSAPALSSEQMVKAALAAFDFWHSYSLRLSNLSSDITTAPPVLEKTKLNPSKVLLLGDSMMLEGLGPPLQQILKKNDGLTVVRDGRYGTGLVRLEVFDWLNYFDQILTKHQPDLVILTVGANDTQDMVPPGQRRVRVASEKWNEIYKERVKDLLQRAEQKGVHVFWVGLPIMGRQPYGERVVNINRLTEEVCQAETNCRFWDSWLSVADSEGKYSTFLPGPNGKTLRVRAKDAIHLTESGGRIMAEKFLVDTVDWADYEQKTEEVTEDASELESGNSEGGGQVVEDKPIAPSGGEGESTTELEGEFLERSFYSAVRGKEVPYFVAQPSAETNSYPVVFLLHGAWDSAAVWAERLGPQKLSAWAAKYGLIIVMPDGEPFGWYLDGPDSKIETYLMSELYPQVMAAEQRANPKQVGILGLSMGGHGALTLALKHPAQFQAVGALSAVTDLALHAGNRHPADDDLKIENVLGEPGEKGSHWRKFSAYGITEAKPELWGGRPLSLSVGRADSLTLAENRSYHQLLQSLGIEHQYRESEGGHTWDYWALWLPQQLEFLSEELRNYD